jgi:hypothetical protein
VKVRKNFTLKIQSTKDEKEQIKLKSSLIAKIKNVPSRITVGDGTMEVPWKCYHMRPFLVSIMLVSF